jgi:hypothetical protein
MDLILRLGLSEIIYLPSSCIYSTGRGRKIACALHYTFYDLFYFLFLWRYGEFWSSVLEAELVCGIQA